MKKGKDSIKVYRDGQSREFGIAEWKQLPDHKYGWKLKADEPEEVTNLKNSSSVNDADGEKLNAADLSKKIYEAETAEAVDALVPDGETRITVLKAAEARKEQLTQA